MEAEVNGLILGVKNQLSKTANNQGNKEPRSNVEEENNGGAAQSLQT